MSMLDRHADPRREPHRIDHVEPVRHRIPRHVALVHDRPVVGVGLALHAPGVVEVVLRARAVQARRPAVVVDEDHLVALAPPAALAVEHGQVAADVVAGSLGVEDDVVAGAVEVDDVGLGRVDLEVRAPAWARVQPIPGRVEIPDVVAQRRAVKLVVDVEVLA
jgi:hypothetical protein